MKPSARFLHAIHYACLVSIVFLGLASIIATGGGGGGGDSSSLPIPEGDYASTIMQEGNLGETGGYAMEIFANAVPAQEQMNQDDIPDVVEQHGDNLYVLDIQKWPDSWDLGRVIVVRLEAGRVTYKRLLARFELDGGGFAIGVTDSSALEVFERLEIDSSGSVAGFVDSERSVYRVIIPYEFKPIMNQIAILDQTNLPVLNDTGIWFGFSEIRLNLNPVIEIFMSMDTPAELTEIYNKGLELRDSIINLRFGTAAVNTAGVFVNVQLATAGEIMTAVLSDSLIGNLLASIRSVLNRPERLKKIVFLLTGDINGAMQVKTEVSTEYADEDLMLPLIPVPLAVPLGGPLPVHLMVQPIAVADCSFGAQVHVESGMTVSIPVNIRAQVIDGELWPIEKHDIVPEFSFPEEYVRIDEATRNGFTSSLGVRMDTALTLDGVIGIAIGPTASVGFDAATSVSGGCADVFWDLYGRLYVMAEAGLLLGSISWDDPFDFYILKDEAPRGFYQYCWDDSDNNPPSALIIAPVNNMSYNPGHMISFTGIGTDPEDGDLPPSAFAWDSSLDGRINAGSKSFSVSRLSTGTHTIHLTVTDSDGATGIVDMNITIHAGASDYRVPDTGQATCYNNTGILSPCPSPFNPFYGQDAHYTINPLSYTRLDNSGNALPDDTIDWSMVRDNITGLIWEVKTDDGGIHDKNDTCNENDAVDVFIARLNTDQFGGYDDWRLPTREELRSIVNYGRYLPAIDMDFFPNTPTSFSYFLSSTPTIHISTDVWLLTFYGGFDGHGSKHLEYYVRAVRGGSSGSMQNPVSNGDGTVTDRNTGLLWMQFTADVNEDGIINVDDEMTWEEALTWCENLTLAGFNDWRLPTIKELASIVDLSRFDPAIDGEYFTDTISSYYWTSTTVALYPEYAWLVNFYQGLDSYNNKSSTYPVRAVRGGQ